MSRGPTALQPLPKGLPLLLSAVALRVVCQESDSGPVLEREFDGLDVSRPIERVRPNVEGAPSRCRGKESLRYLNVALAMEHLRLGNLLGRRALRLPGPPSGAFLQEPPPGRPERQVAGRGCARGDH